MRAPSIEQLEMAAEWLDAYDAESDGAAECYAVAKWLRARAKAALERQVEAAAIAEFAAEKGLPIARVRAALAATRKQKRAGGLQA